MGRLLSGTHLSPTKQLGGPVFVWEGCRQALGEQRDNPTEEKGRILKGWVNSSFHAKEKSGEWVKKGLLGVKWDIHEGGKEGFLRKTRRD